MTRYLITINNAPSLYVESVSVWDAFVSLYPPGYIVGLFGTLRGPTLRISASLEDGTAITILIEPEHTRRVSDEVTARAKEAIAWTN